MKKTIVFFALITSLTLNANTNTALNSSQSNNVTTYCEYMPYINGRFSLGDIHRVVKNGDVGCNEYVTVTTRAIDVGGPIPGYEVQHRRYKLFLKYTK
ncbi:MULTISPECIES: hypothetical protein [Pseudoalteromonas]|uniref:DUF1496 domain-containing protein n=2 Tax=Pseudoalteromonas TaxID=53246 RepID=A0AAD0RH21_PSEO7|nr:MULTISPECIES: hypothetical protein [Pseudoalteromonas]ASD67102.1 hypothetical protein B1L02_08735 [Pseudoalteromonas piscicida]AXR02191.1 hypothetical protein D0511_09040 [Pseudoalteromonas piscicida]KJY89198.1 hypothetical protein TW75_11035 [Pseudoalteromonas piscicida]NLR23626.1 hypothetical protein [Pseudoalteromonas maricaloris]RZG05445.1 hypothetical protein EXT48_07880 [Pseudoalteromonas sp. CO348]